MAAAPRAKPRGRPAEMPAYLPWNKRALRCPLRSSIQAIVAIYLMEPPTMLATVQGPPAVASGWPLYVATRLESVTRSGWTCGRAESPGQRRRAGDKVWAEAGRQRGPEAALAWA